MMCVKRLKVQTDLLGQAAARAAIDEGAAVLGAAIAQCLAVKCWHEHEPAKPQKAHDQHRKPTEPRHRFLAFLGFCFRVDGSPAGGGGVFSRARMASSTVPRIPGRRCWIACALSLLVRFLRLGNHLHLRIICCAEVVRYRPEVRRLTSRIGCPCGDSLRHSQRCCWSL
jgi:hypothetical protein